MRSDAPTVDADADLRALVAEIRACRVCAPRMQPEPRPVVRLHADARVLIVGQAPGVRVHAVGAPFVDASGDRLRDWMGVDEAIFYDPAQVAVAPAGFCFPGLDAKGGDRPPRKECAPLWRDRVRAALPNVRVTLLVGGYAHRLHLGPAAAGGVTETVKAWRAHLPGAVALPHPSWRNTAWIKKHPWFEAELVPELRGVVSRALGSS